jgi:plasmid maintenance system antidote protein VapI
VKIYNESHRGFVFAVVQGAGLLHVVPRQMTGLSGNLEAVKPVLDAVITIAPKERTSYALLEEICKKISIATNTRVEMGTISANLLYRTKTSIGGSGKSARSILEQLILQIGARLPLSWQHYMSPVSKIILYTLVGYSQLKNNSPARDKPMFSVVIFRSRRVMIAMGLMAAFLGGASATLSDLVNEKAALSPEMALRVEKAFGVSMGTLLRMQAWHDGYAHAAAGRGNRRKEIHAGNRVVMTYAL